MDTIKLICEIILSLDAFVLLWAGYIWYLDRLWNIQVYRDAQKRIECPVWVLLDKDDTEIARFD